MNTRELNDWWKGQDFATMERISGLRMTDYPDSTLCENGELIYDGYEAFVQACEQWFNNLTKEDKIRILLAENAI